MSFWSSGFWTSSFWTSGFWTSGGGSPPSAIADLAASSVPGERVSLSWTAPAGATSFKVYRATSTGLTSGTGTLVGTTGASSFLDEGLVASTTYYYVVVASNAAGDSADSNEANAAAGAVAVARGRPQSRRLVGFFRR